jgi:hypothetical protein
MPMSRPEQELNQQRQEVLPSAPPAPSREAGLSREVRGYLSALPRLLELLQAGSGASAVRAFLEEEAAHWGLSPVKLYRLGLQQLPRDAPLPPPPQEVFPDFVVNQAVQEPQPQPEPLPQPQPLREVRPEVPERPQAPLRPLPVPRQSPT